MEGARFQALGETPTIVPVVWPGRGSCALLRGILTGRDEPGIRVGGGQPHHLRLGDSTRRHCHSPHQALREVAARLVNEASDFREHRPCTRLASSRLARYAGRRGKCSSLMSALPISSPRPRTRLRIQIRRFGGGPRLRPRRRGRSATGSGDRQSYARGCPAAVAYRSR